jgi:hypothetical protein
MSKARRGIVGMTVGSLLALVVLAVLLIQDRDSPIDRSAVPEGTSCIGQPSSLVDAAATMPFPILLAQTELANAATVTDVLICAADQVEIDYASGVIVTLGANHLRDPEAEWQGLAEQYPEFTVGTVRGVSASLADPDKGAIGGVDLVENGVRITVTGDGEIPLEDLISVAESLAVTDLPSPSPSVSPSASGSATAG